MLARLFLLFLVVPVVDLALLVALGDRLGLWPTLALVVSTAAAGSWLARREGSAAWRRVQHRLAEGGVPGPELIDGLIVLAAGVLLVAPGFLTDAAGLLGLVPASRAWLRRRLAARWTRAIAEGRVRVATGPFGGSPTRDASPFPTQASVVEDAEVVDDGRAAGHKVAKARL